MNCRNNFRSKQTINLPYLLLYQQSLEVMYMAQAIPVTVALPLSSNFSDSKEGMAQMLSFPLYHFVNHFKSTTPYLTNYFTIFRHYHLLQADIPLFIHDNNIWSSGTLMIVVINVLKNKWKINDVRNWNHWVKNHITW